MVKDMDQEPELEQEEIREKVKKRKKPKARVQKESAGSAEMDHDQPSTIFYMHSLLLFGGRLMHRTLDFYNSLFDITPTDKARIYRNISIHYANKGLHDKALDYLREWARLDPDNPDPHYQLGVAQAAAGNLKKAVRSYEATLKLSPTHKRAMYRKAALCLKLKDYEGAVETLKELDRLRSGLLANVSHELRTPLTSIKGFATTLLRSDVQWSEEDQRDFLQSIDQETERLIRLINDLLDMSRIEAGGLKLDKHNYQIADILNSVNSRLASLTEHHQLQVIVPSELPPVFVDEMHIGQVLTNLVENATKYSGEGSPITIEAQLAGAQIIVSVTDRGQGIPAELLDKVFDRFYQAESIVTGRKSGTGLGLSICKGIIESHSGRIWVESKLGEGSKFSFSLPVGKGEEEIA